MGNRPVQMLAAMTRAARVELLQGVLSLPPRTRARKDFLQHEVTTPGISRRGEQGWGWGVRGGGF